MEILFAEIETALRAGVNYMAVVLALMLPDICAALASDNGRAHPDKYKPWYDANLASRFPGLTADDIYSLRCAVLHQGKLEHPGMQYTRVVLVLPFMGNQDYSRIKDAYGLKLSMSVEFFCLNVVQAARDWLNGNLNDENVKRNLANMVQLRPQGFQGIGAPAIA